MNIYIVVIVSLALLSLLYLLVGKKEKRGCYIIGCLIVLPLIVFRDISVGSDTVKYCNIFSYYSMLPWKECFSFRWEPGLLLIMKFISTFVSSDSRAYIIIIGLISLIPLFVLINKDSPLPIISLIIFMTFLFTDAEYLNRQWLAVVVLMFSYKYIRERKFVKFVICVLLAMCFHTSAIIFIVVYFIFRLPFSKTNIFISAILCVFLAFVGPYLLPIMRIFARGEVTSFNNGGYALLVLLWLCLISTYVFTGKRRVDDDKYQLYIRMLWIAAVTQPLVFSYHLFSRVIVYFYIAILFVIPFTLEDFIYNNGSTNRKLSPVVITIFEVVVLSYYFVIVPNDFAWMSILR